MRMIFHARGALLRHHYAATNRLAGFQYEETVLFENVAEIVHIRRRSLSHIRRVARKKSLLPLFQSTPPKLPACGRTALSCQDLRNERSPLCMAPAMFSNPVLDVDKEASGAISI